MREHSGIEERFFQLLQIAVGKDVDARISFTADEWSEVYQVASEQSLVSVVLHAIDMLGENLGRPPQPLLLQWIGESELIRQRNHRANQLCRKLSSWFKSKGYDSCILKGQGVARLYTIPDSRQSGDIDIWVNANIDDIVNIMLHDCLGVSYVDYVNCHVTFFTDIDVEVHFRPSYMFNPFVNHRVQQWIKDNKRVQFLNYDKDLGYSHPKVGFDLVFSLLHIYRHVFLEGIGLRQLMDYYFILNHSTKQERIAAFSVFKSFGMKKFTAVAMYVLKRVFNIEENLLLCEPDGVNGEFLLSEIIKGGNFGKYDDRNVYVSNEKRVEKGLNNIKRNIRYINAYPSEVLWMPVFKVWHWCWRKHKGYL